MIRPARFQDAAAIEALIRRQHERSHYAGRVGIADKALENLVMGLIAGMNQHGPHGTHVVVNEEDGKVVGFFAGVLQRIYNIGDRLGACDQYLVNEGRVTASLQMVDSYVEWAKANPKVLEIGLTWTDAMPDGERAAKLYERKGFRRNGESFVLALDIPERAAA